MIIFFKKIPGSIKKSIEGNNKLLQKKNILTPRQYIYQRKKN